MNVNTLVTSLRDAIHDDAATKAWCQTNYGQDQQVFVGIDTRNPPEMGQYPLVHIFPLTKRAGGGTQEHSVGITCGIYDDDMRTTSKANVVELEGVQNLESFRKLVESAIDDIDFGDVNWLADMSVSYETIEFFPYFLCSMELRIDAEIPFGEDQLQ